MSRWLEPALELRDWMAAREYRGWDPYDLLASPLVRCLAFGSRWLAVAWTQLGVRSPVQLRGLLGVPRTLNPKTLALALGAHLRLAEAARRAERAEVAASLREAVPDLVAGLEERAVGRELGVGWGYPFPWANRSFRIPAGTPSSVVTAFVGHALLDAAGAPAVGAADSSRLSDERRTAGRARSLALEGARFLSRELNRVEDENGGVGFSYTPRDDRVVHNASLLAASLMARAAVEARAEDGETEGLLRDARRAARFTLTAQRPDGSWPYGTARRDDWEDSFHTAYVLLALDRIRKSVNDGPASTAGSDEDSHGLLVAAIGDAVERGLRHWLDVFFEGPAVGLWPRRAHPIDSHAVAVAILTLLRLRDEAPLVDAPAGGTGPERARALAAWALEEMRTPDGCFHFRHHRTFRNRMCYMRWSQAWMLAALAGLAGHDAGEGDE